MAEEKKYLSIDEMLAADDVEFAEAQAWGGVVRFGTLNAEAMIDFVSQNEGPAKRNAGIRLLVDSLVDANGNRIGKKAHIEFFKKKSAAVINRLCEIILELNGMKDKALDFAVRFAQAGTDREKLKTLHAEMVATAAALEAVLAEEVIDKKALKRIAEGASVEELEAKNASSGTTA